MTHDILRDIYYLVRRRTGDGGYKALADNNNESQRPITQLEDAPKEGAQEDITPEIEEQIQYWDKNFGKFRLVLERLPWKILPFVVSMFVLVEGLHHTGWVGVFASGMSSVINGSVGVGIFFVGLTSVAVCSLINNQPMTILFTHILQHPKFMADDVR